MALKEANVYTSWKGLHSSTYPDNPRRCLWNWKESYGQ